MLLTLVFGFVFGLLLSIARVNRNSVIAGMSTLEDFRVAKTMAAAIGLGMVLIAAFVLLGWAHYHIKPLIPGGIFLGGLLFGAGMAILGYCPGTLTISMGQGSLDALIGALGGLAGGAAYTLAKPELQPILNKDLGKRYLYAAMEDHPLSYFLVSVLLGAGILFMAFAIHKKDQKKQMNWLYAGLGLGILNGIMILDSTAGRTIGASTAFPFLADSLLGWTDNDYFHKIKASGSWQSVFLVGALLAGSTYALFKKEFKWQLIYGHWEKYKGNNKAKRIFWAFFGGFILLFGARMAGGCTSGHILSGVMQLSLSSLLFMVVVFISFLLTGKFFYAKK